MNSEHVRQLIEAARSGHYRQAFGTLHDPCSSGYCILGLACEVFRQATGIGYWSGESFCIDDEEFWFMAPVQVTDWYGFDAALLDDLYDLNDDGQKPLGELAGILEKRLSKEA